ncbi:methylmalonyl-CoA epimerase [Bhargavaea beijingensis]|uniref:Methylmalonyl-CoA epimerase n=1 Tax=Bhargavaea beijingensis TaxID=426756 RepID=A0A1G7DI47_9BACL|nr:methylmalonyl-CoA epimerase [Bhargavaea beijingensis]MCW1927174.1 methylmalonyl-CoA epimerase [Bhargavaea beijingensis]RSK30893.1 methylmalonyl-CoA epimerase [Bhargavaea beijingensis]SDE51181.1 methylmalonyl-CoA epimerase [Bhargavaea beijingensis]
MEKVDHIGIAVKNLDAVLPYYTDTLGIRLMGIEDVPTQGIRVAFLDAGNVKLELLEPASETGAVAKFIEKRGEGVHHIAFGVTGIQERMDDLRENGVRLLSDGPVPGAGGAQVAFMHPKSSYGVLYELCDKSGNQE